MLGYLKQLLQKRPDLKLIVTSATIDTERFAQHFDNAPVINVEGRTFPVEVRYRPLEGEAGEPAAPTTLATASVAMAAMANAPSTMRSWRRSTRSPASIRVATC